jgi:hypothetical protein
VAHKATEFTLEIGDARTKFLIKAFPFTSSLEKYYDLFYGRANSAAKQRESAQSHANGL